MRHSNWHILLVRCVLKVFQISNKKEESFLIKFVEKGLSPETETEQDLFLTSFNARVKEKQLKNLILKN